MRIKYGGRNSFYMERVMVYILRGGGVTLCLIVYAYAGKYKMVTGWIYQFWKYFGV